MNRPDHSTYREWLNLEVDGLLADTERARFEEHLASCADCRQEREELLALGALLERSSLPVRQDFKASVLDSLPAAGWEGRAPRTWQMPAAVFVLLGGLAAALMTTGPSTAGGSAGASALVAIAEMLRAAVLAGAGLLNASWKGTGLVVQELISSPVSLGVFGFLVLCLNLLVLSLARRRRPVEAPASHLAGPGK